MELDTFIGPAITAALVSSIVILFNNRRTLQDSLDSKSGWRKDLFNVASKTFLTTDDIYLILAALRYQPKAKWDEDEKKAPQDFQEMTAYIYYILCNMLKKYKYDDTAELKANKISECIKVLSSQDATTVRLLTKYLLKHHWEDLGRGYFGRLEFKILKEREIFKNIFDNIQNNKLR